MASGIWYGVLEGEDADHATDDQQDGRRPRIDVRAEGCDSEDGPAESKEDEGCDRTDHHRTGDRSRHDLRCDGSDLWRDEALEPPVPGHQDGADERHHVADKTQPAGRVGLAQVQTRQRKDERDRGDQCERVLHRVEDVVRRLRTHGEAERKVQPLARDDQGRGKQANGADPAGAGLRCHCKSPRASARPIHIWLGRSVRGVLDADEIGADAPQAGRRGLVVGGRVRPLRRLLREVLAGEPLRFG